MPDGSDISKDQLFQSQHYPVSGVMFSWLQRQHRNLVISGNVPRFMLLGTLAGGRLSPSASCSHPTALALAAGMFLAPLRQLGGSGTGLRRKVPPETYSPLRGLSGWDFMGHSQ